MNLPRTYQGLPKDYPSTTTVVAQRLFIRASNGWLTLCILTYYRFFGSCLVIFDALDLDGGKKLLAIWYLFCIFAASNGELIELNEFSIQLLIPQAESRIVRIG